jgi:hypothetical protein
MELTQEDKEILVGFIGEWIEQLGDNDNGDLVRIYNKLINGDNE